MNRKQVLDTVTEEMMELYSKLKEGAIERVDADSLFNGAGKILKGVQLHLADEVWDAEKRKMLPSSRALMSADQLLAGAGA